MTASDLCSDVARNFRLATGGTHSVAAYAPGRIEVLGNHTDYNEGFVLSAAINMGIAFLAAPSPDTTCRVYDAKFKDEVTFDVRSPTPSPQKPWANYIKGVLSGLQKHGRTDRGFSALVQGDIPIGAGLSSSAALEIASGLALCELYGIRLDSLDLARIAQAAEHTFVGVKCGLLDQISSLYGREEHVVMCDFRSLHVEALPTGADACFLMCNTRVKHALVDGEYNERRARCEEAAACFARVLPHPVRALRDVSWDEWQRFAPGMDPVTARRAAHIIGENRRVSEGKRLLEGGDLEAFGRLMFESHASSRDNFENSCAELDTLVDAASRIPGIMGARLSGGGFGGSAIALAHRRDAEVAGQALASAYARTYGHPAEVQAIIPSAGARLLKP